MGFDMELFVEQPVDSNLLCAICLSVQDQPARACMNGHTFCFQCLDQWSEQLIN